jgi:acetolactate synthase-1/2/3 large subunit
MSSEPKKMSTSGKQTGNRYLAEAMKHCGAEYLFYMPMVLPEAIKEMESLGIHPIAGHSEKGIAYMADGYARASGKLAFCAAQNIGSSNLAAAMLDGYMARSPILALTGGNTPETRYRNYYQDIDQQPVWAAMTKYNARVDHVSRFPDLLGQAMRMATTGSNGPVHLELDNHIGAVLNGEIPGALLPDPTYARAPAIRHAAPSEQVEAALKTIARAKKPVILAGSGIRNSGAQAQLRAFAQKTGIPVATSLDAKEVMAESDPLSIGVIGTYSRKTANMTVAEADLAIFVGTTTGSMISTVWTVPKPGIDAIQIDVDPLELGRNYPLLAGLCGDPATVLEQLTAAVGQQPDRSSWLERVARGRSDWRQSAAEMETKDTAPIRPEMLCRTISDVLPDDALLFVDTGHSGDWAAKNIYLEKPTQRLFRAAGSLGWSYPASLGGKCACPDRPVVCFNGDGAFFYHLSEMETAKRHGINTVTVVNNNSAFNQEIPAWNGNPTYEHHWKFEKVNFKAVAEGFGVKAFRVEDPADLAETLREALTIKAPVIVEVISDQMALAEAAWTP